MTILIKGWKMPKHCYDSPLCYIASCTPVYNGHNSSCPLVEIPTPHGRLVDADELLKGKSDHDTISTHEIWNAPTIIESEE